MPTETFLNLSKEKKDKIIKAAKKEFARVPISEVSIKNIVEEAQIARGSFYQYFVSKEDLLKYLLKDKMEKVDEIAKESIEKSHGDIFEVYISMYDFVMSKKPKNEDLEFHRQILSNVKTSDESFYALRNFINLDKVNGPFSKEEFISKIDRSKFVDKSDEELSAIIKLLFMITKKAVVSNFKYESKEAARKEYIRMIDIIKRGVYNG